VVSIMLSWFIDQWCAIFFWFYLINTLIYTYFLKEKVIIDVFMISFGFLLRWAIGIVISDSIVSPWFLIMIFFGSLFLWFSKRYQETTLYSQNEISSRKNIHEYNEEFLKQVLSIFTSFLLVSYTLYAFQSIQWSRMIWTIPVVTFWIIRFYYNIFFLWKNSMSLENIILKDKPLIGSIFIYCILSIILIYVIPNTISSL
jgi:4-hydroxybenzoate polyprenyltransferase